MRRTCITLLLGCLLAVAGVILAAPASACSCAGGTTREFFDRADAVFTGTLISRDMVHPGGAVSSTSDPALHIFAVDAVFKGDVHERQGVVSPDHGAGCGLELAGDGPFMVFATRSADLGGGPFTGLSDDQYAAFLCDGTAPVDAALAADLAALAGSPMAPRAEADPLPGAAGVEPAGSSVPVAALAASGAAVLLMGAVLARRRWSRSQ